MASGAKTMVINTQERAVSVDINRLQEFVNASRGEFARYQMDVSLATDDLDASGVHTEITTSTNPLTAEIMSGLTVQPQVASLNVNIAPGALNAINPDNTEISAGGDSSVYKQIVDSGSTGVLAMTGNSSGSTRIDVIECQVATVISETDSRDIFNPATGLFSAQTVTKAVKDSLTYRIRQGTAGSGFPGTVAGWLPLAVASVPTATTTNDTITFWDVRPLVADRNFQPHNVSTQRPKTRGIALADDVTNNPKTMLMGEVECGGVDFFGSAGYSTYRLGGRIRRGTPGLDGPNAGLPDGIDLTDAANQSGSMIASSPTYVYLCEPFGLPRWARYTDALSGVRKPRSCRGMAVVSQVGPYHGTGAPSGAITLPTATGLVGSTSKAWCIFVTSTNGSARVMGGVMDEGGSCFWDTQTFTTPAGTLSGAANNRTITFNLADGSTHPPNAKGIWCQVAFTFTPAATWAGEVTLKSTMQVNGGPAPYVGQQQTIFVSSVNILSNPVLTWLFYVPIITAYPSISSPGNRQLAVNITSTASFTLSGTSLTVIGAKIL